MWILKNWPYKIAALVAAGLLWAGTQGIRQSEEQAIDIPIVPIDVPEGLVVVDQSVLEVNLRIVGSRAALRRAQRELERYLISLTAAKPGESRFSITRERLSMPRGATVTASAPSSVTVLLEPVRKKRVPVRADVFGSPAEGYRVVEVRVEPNEVLLEGARTKIRRIAEVRTDRLDVSRLRETSVHDGRNTRN